MNSLVLAVFLLVTAAAAETPSPSPAQRAISAAQDEIRKDPQLSRGYNDLAKALVRRGRETGDPDYYQQARRAVNDSLRVEPDNFEGNKARVLVLLGEHEDIAALELARKLNRRTPDDVPVRGMIADACMELGDYEAAEKSAQWMLALRRGNLPGMVHGALLRRFFGDMDGAVDWFTSVFKLTNSTETEERAWLLNQIARIRLETGKVDLADQILTQALGVFPDYYLTLDSLAETRIQQGKYGEAADLLRRAQTAAPHPRRLFSLAVALKEAGMAAQAGRTFAQFEREAGELTGKPDNANRELVFYYADEAHEPGEALRVARAEIARRHDIRTLDAYAWALYSNAQFAEARVELDKALNVGIRDASLFEHAAAIAEKLKDQRAAAKYQKQARELRP